MPSSACKKCARSEEHTSELQSHDNLVCRLLLEKKQTYRQRPEGGGSVGLAPLYDGSRSAIGRRPPFHVRGDVRTADPPPQAVLLFFFLMDARPPEFSPLPLPDALPT